MTGASIADNALAWWLGRDGSDVTLVEHAPAFQIGRVERVDTPACRRVHQLALRVLVPNPGGQQ